MMFIIYSFKFTGSLKILSSLVVCKEGKLWEEIKQHKMQLGWFYLDPSKYYRPKLKNKKFL